MRIWLVQTGEQLPVREDTEAMRLRTLLLAEELASCFNHMRKEWYFSEDKTFEPIDGVTVHALHGLGYKKNVSLRRLADY